MNRLSAIVRVRRHNGVAQRIRAGSQRLAPFIGKAHVTEVLAVEHRLEETLVGLSQASGRDVMAGFRVGTSVWRQPQVIEVVAGLDVYPPHPAEPAADQQAPHHARYEDHVGRDPETEMGIVGQPRQRDVLGVRVVAQPRPQSTGGRRIPDQGEPVRRVAHNEAFDYCFPARRREYAIGHGAPFWPWSGSLAEFRHLLVAGGEQVVVVDVAVQQAAEVPVLVPEELTRLRERLARGDRALMVAVEEGKECRREAGGEPTGTFASVPMNARQPRLRNRSSSMLEKNGAAVAVSHPLRNARG